MAKHGASGIGVAPEIGADQALDERTDATTGVTSWVVRDLTADEIARRDRTAAVAAFLATDPAGDDPAAAALRALLRLEGW